MSSAPPPETRVPWAPNMIYRPRRPAAAPQTLCELYIEQQVVTFFRHYIPLGHPGFDYGHTMERATKFAVVTDLYLTDEGFKTSFEDVMNNRPTTNALVTSVFQDQDLVGVLTKMAGGLTNDPLAASRVEKLNLYAQEADIMDQLVWAVTHPEDAHSKIRRDLSDVFFIAVLLIRHFKHNGGIILPPLLAARVTQDAHEEVLRKEKEAGRGVENVFIRYPKW